MIYCDNNSTIKLSQNPILHDRSKHIDVKYYYLRELTNRKVINLIYCKSEKQLTDIFTKLLKLSTFEKLTRLIGVYNV